MAEAAPVAIEEPLPGLTADSIGHLACEWDDGGRWADVMWLADRCWTADEDLRREHWHHLVLAVGNFKRRPGQRLLSAALSTGRRPSAQAVRQPIFEVPGDGARLDVAADRVESWKALQSALPGAGTATTTTLLAALWPSLHFVYDKRVQAAANGLRLHADLPAMYDAESSSVVSVSWTGYARVRSWVEATATAAGQELAAVERALYILDQHVADRQSGRSWPEYGAHLAADLEGATPQR